MKKQNGITLIAVVVTVVILLILAGVSISSTMKGGGIFSTVTQAANQQEISAIKSDLEVIQANWMTQKILNDNITEEDLIQEIVKEKIVESRENIEGGNGNYQLTTPKGYVFEMIIDYQGNTSVEYLGKEGEVAPRIGYLSITQTSTNSITVKITLKNQEETPSITYYYKSQKDASYIQAEANTSQTTYTYTGLQSYCVYDLKVVITKGGQATELKTTATTVNVRKIGIKQTIDSPIWNNSTHTAIVKLEQTEVLPEGSTIQYKINNQEPWKAYNEQINGLTHGDIIIVRIVSSAGESLGETTISVLDNIAPKPATIQLSANTIKTGETITATVTHTDNESGIQISNCRWVYTESSSPIGNEDVNIGQYTESFSSNTQPISLTISKQGSYYLHILSVDSVGNKRETISSQIVVNDANSSSGNNNGNNNSSGGSSNNGNSSNSNNNSSNPTVELPTGWNSSKVIAVKSADGVTVPVPLGFTSSSVISESKVANGFVIYQGSEEVTAENLNAAQGSRNQFVWVPVEKPNEMFGTDRNGNTLGKLYDFGNGKASTVITLLKSPPTPLNWSETNGIMSWTSTTTTTSYREPDIVGNANANDNNSSYYISNRVTNKNQMIVKDGNEFKKQLQTEIKELRTSVETYGGFYIGRYISSLSTTKINTVTPQKIKVIRGAASVKYNWYISYQLSKEIVQTTPVDSHLIWGCQWDAMIKWFISQGKGSFVMNVNGKNGINSFNESEAVNNIFGIAETAYSMIANQTSRVAVSNNKSPACYTNVSPEATTTNCYSTRATLII